MRAGHVGYYKRDDAVKIFQLYTERKILWFFDGSFWTGHFGDLFKFEGLE